MWVISGRYVCAEVCLGQTFGFPAVNLPLSGLRSTKPVRLEDSTAAIEISFCLLNFNLGFEEEIDL